MNIIVASIFKSHVRRLGFLRATIGGWFLYTTIPLFIFLYVVVVTLSYSLVWQPLLRLQKKRYSSYIILDRYNIKELSLFDRFNCLFCEYASGISMLLNAETDVLASEEFPTIHPLTAIFLYMLAFIQTILLVLFVFLTAVPTYIFMVALRYKRISTRKVMRLLHKQNYASQHPVYIIHMLRIHKIIVSILLYNLSQIESQWCPIKHLEKSGQITPRYQKSFIPRNRINLLEEILLSEKGIFQNNIDTISDIDTLE